MHRFKNDGDTTFSLVPACSWWITSVLAKMHSTLKWLRTERVKYGAGKKGEMEKIEISEQRCCCLA